MFRHLWHHRCIFILDDDLSRQRFRAMTKLVLDYLDFCMVRRVPPPFEQTNVVELVLLSWFHSNPVLLEDNSYKLASRTLEALAVIGRHQGEDGYDDSIVKKIILVEFGAEAYVDRFLRNIDEESRIDLPLETSLCAFHFYFSNEAIINALNARSAHIRLVRALKRQMEHGGKNEQWNVIIQSKLWAYASAIIGHCLTSFRHLIPFSPESPSDYADMIEIAAQSVVICLYSEYDESCKFPGLLLTLLEPLVRVLKLMVADEACCAPALTLARESARKRWYHTMRSLRGTDSDMRSPIQKSQTKKLVFSWRHLGETMGLREKDERERVAELKKSAQTFCAWSECVYHTLKPDGALRTCTGCDEARYCRRSCQTKDWKAGHKKKCRRLTA
ncbi:hypothetical protein OF83DRAFT_1180603 [Amylostereum chailletii]|nr:hypothetical protein OF83DRAFT_1180603 [Amylostereum chailletii]